MLTHLHGYAYPAVTQRSPHAMLRRVMSRPDANREEDSSRCMHVPHANRDPAARRVYDEGRRCRDLHGLCASVPRDVLSIDRRPDQAGIVAMRVARVPALEVNLIRQRRLPWDVRAHIVSSHDAGQPQLPAHAAFDTCANGEAKWPRTAGATLC